MPFYVLTRFTAKIGKMRLVYFEATYLWTLVSLLMT